MMEDKMTTLNMTIGKQCRRLLDPNTLEEGRHRVHLDFDMKVRHQSDRSDEHVGNKVLRRMYEDSDTNVDEPLDALGPDTWVEVLH